LLVIGGRDHDVARAVSVNAVGQQETPNRLIRLLEQCEGATLNSQRWTTTATTMTVTQSATQITLNASNITTINTGVLLSSRATFSRITRAPLTCRIRCRFTTVANAVAEWGIGQMATLSGVTAILDNGAHWRRTSTGAVVPVMVNAGTEITGSDVSASLNVADYYDYIVAIEDDRVTWEVRRSDTGVVISRQILRVPLTGTKLFAVTHLNAWLRVRNTGVAPASAGNLFVSEVEVDQLDILHGLRLDDQLSGAAQAILYSPTAFTQSAAFANSAAPASAVLSNTAAGYATLGGLWQFAAVATAATDFCLFGFAVPAPYRLKLTGVTITCYNTGAANAATPATTMLWGLGVNGASANLATGAHIRRALGTTSIPISAAIGAEGSALHIDFETPIYCEPGTTLAVIMRVVAGAATASQIIAGTCNFAGAFE
jgi:hypothetical protein